MEKFINALYFSLLNYVEYIESPIHYDYSMKKIFKEYNLTEEQQKLFIEFYKPDILHQHGGYRVCLNNYEKIMSDTNPRIGYSAKKKMVEHLYKDENREKNLSRAMEDFIKWNEDVIHDRFALYIEYENNDIKSITYMDLECKNAIKFNINYEGLKKLIMYSDDLDDNFYYNNCNTTEDKIEYFNKNLKYDNIPIKELEEFELFSDLKLMAITNYM